MTPGVVSLVLSAASYTAGQTIVVTIQNGLNATILTADHKTNCTMVTLQMQSANSWVDLSPCQSMMPTHLMELAALSATAVALGSGAQSDWGAGTYRVQFEYTTAAPGASATPGPVYSTPFAIN